MTSHATLLDRVRKLLAKAEAEGVTPAEAEALTTKAAELMAKYGIDREFRRKPPRNRPARHSSYADPVVMRTRGGR